MTRLTVTKISNLNNTLVIRQFDGRDCFIASQDSIIISVSNLASILQFLIMNGYMSHKVLEGILEEYHMSGKERNG